MNKEGIKYILFDVGNVLVYKRTHEDENVAKLLGLTREEYRKILDEIIENQSQEEKDSFKNINTVEKEKIYLDRLHEKMCKYLDIDYDTNLINRMTDCRMKGDFALKEDTISSLEELSKRYRLGIFSNALPSRRVHELKIGNLDTFFEHIFISKEIGLEKPKIEAYEYVIDRIGVDKESVLFVDDKVEYLEGAIKAGIENVILFKNKEVSEKYTVIERLGELGELFNTSV